MLSIYMRLSFLSLFLLIMACSSSPSLQEGRWTGTLTPMNHPEIQNPVAYNVSYPDNRLSISVLGPGGEEIPTQNPRLQRDTLFFSFNEPEEQVLLDCALARKSDNTFGGRCSDSEGKWAEFTMEPPS